MLTSNSNLGKPCINSKVYYPSSINKMDVSFRPIKKDGSINYIPIIENEYEVVIPQYMEVDKEQEQEKEIPVVKKSDIFDLKHDYINTFYIGSITIVGLFILYRILDRTK